MRQRSEFGAAETDGLAEQHPGEEGTAQRWGPRSLCGISLGALAKSWATHVLNETL